MPDDIDTLKIHALAAHFKVSPEDITEGRYGNFIVEGELGEYEVLTDEEADERWEESLDSYLDDYILPELPDTAQQYFDRDAWKRDARHDGRAHAINSYDGNEEEIKIDGVSFYIYRTN